jgi:ribosomal protein S18 acetylase RimI-like enzyme
MIEKATLQDVNTIYQLVNSAYRGETAKKGWTTEAYILAGERISEAELQQIITTENNAIFLYKINNVLEGTVLLINHFDHLYLGMLTVNPNIQNNGIGKKLLFFAEDYAKTLGLSKIKMTVITLRTELLNWYTKHGYTDTGKREPFPTEYDEVVLHHEPLVFAVLEKQLI